jgi:hypothetical protein
VSLANLIVQPGRACLLTDSGHFGKGGVIEALDRKIIEIPRLRIAITTTGYLLCRYLEREIAHAAPATADELFARLPELVLCAAATNDIDCTREPSQILIAHYSERAGRAVGYMLRTARHDWPADMQPWTLYPVTECLGPRIDLQAALGRDADLSDPSAFNPARDGMAIVHAQRAPRSDWWTADKEETVCVAGTIRLTAVSSAGVETVDLHAWPDRVGERAAA